MPRGESETGEEAQAHGWRRLVSVVEGEMEGWLAWL